MAQAAVDSKLSGFTPAELQRFKEFLSEANQGGAVTISHKQPTVIRRKTAKGLYELSNAKHKWHSLKLLHHRVKLECEMCKKDGRQMFCPHCQGLMARISVLTNQLYVETMCLSSQTDNFIAQESSLICKTCFKPIFGNEDYEGYEEQAVCKICKDTVERNENEAAAAAAKQEDRKRKKKRSA